MHPNFNKGGRGIRLTELRLYCARHDAAVCHECHKERSRDRVEGKTLALVGEAHAGGNPTMLVITRREGEEVVIGNPAAPLGIVRIAMIKGDRVRIAFEFPREIDVHRREVADQILKDEESGGGIAGQIRPGDSR